MKRAPWSLSRRVGLTIIIGSSLPPILAFGIGEIYVRTLTREHFEKLALEEVQEGYLYLKDHPHPGAELLTLIEALGSHHPEAILGWWISHSNGNSQGYGEATSGQQAPIHHILDEVEFLGNNRWTIGTRIDSQRILTLLAIERGPLPLMSQYNLFASLTILLCIGMSIWIASKLTRSLRKTLDQVIAEVLPGKPNDENPRNHRLPEEIVKVASSLRALLERAQKESREFSVFTASLAHELRSPVQNMISEAELALMRTRDPSEYAEVLSNQLEELHCFRSAIDALLSICRLSADSTPRIEEHIQLADEIIIRIRQEQTRAQRSNISVSLQHVGDTSLVGNREALMRGIRNVVCNAVDWSPEGGTVDITVTDIGDAVTVTIDDSGPGVPEKDLRHLFDPFTRGDNQPHGRIGFGLGLSLTQRAVESQGGRIEVSRSPSGGARFTLYLPRSPCKDTRSVTDELGVSGTEQQDRSPYPPQ